MFERFTNGARQVIILAWEAAGRRQGSAIEPEHLLIALTIEEDGLALPALREMGVEPSSMRERMREDTP